MASRLPADRLPKGTRRDLSLLLRRCLELDAHRVAMPRAGILAARRVMQYLDVNDIEGGKSVGRDWKIAQGGE
jgi:hypothetical protein